MDITEQDGASLDDIHYLVDPNDVIIWCSDPALIRKECTLFDLFIGEEVKIVYKGFHQALRSGQRKKISFCWRCDCAKFRRDLCTLIEPYQDKRGCLLYRSIVVTQRRQKTAISFLENKIVDQQEEEDKLEATVKVCTYCMRVAKRVHPGEEWVDAEEYMEHGGPKGEFLSHGVCPQCYVDIKGILGAHEEEDSQMSQTQASVDDNEEISKPKPREDSSPPLSPLPVVDLTNDLGQNCSERSGFMQTSFGEKNTRVLAVDDDIMQQKLVERILKREEMHGTFVSSGIEALEILKAETFDVILLDIVMKGMDGLQVAKRIRQMEIDTPIIALSGTIGQHGWNQKCLKSGMNDYSGKPIHRKSLLALIQKWTNKQKEK